MNTNFSLREANLNDLSLLQPVFEKSVRQTCIRHYSKRQIDAWINKASPERWKELLESDLHFIVAEDTEKDMIAGFTSINKKGYLHSMFVAPDYQRQKVASLLLKAAESFAGRHHAEFVFTEASKTAKPFFEFMGYQTERKQTVSVNQVEMINFLMKKYLSIKTVSNENLSGY